MFCFWQKVSCLSWLFRHSGTWPPPHYNIVHVINHYKIVPEENCDPHHKISPYEPSLATDCCNFRVESSGRNNLPVMCLFCAFRSKNTMCHCEERIFGVEKLIWLAEEPINYYLRNSSPVHVTERCCYKANCDVSCRYESPRVKWRDGERSVVISCVTAMLQAR
jgi:hypothetical protein